MEFSPLIRPLLPTLPQFLSLWTSCVYHTEPTFLCVLSPRSLGEFLWAPADSQYHLSFLFPSLHLLSLEYAYLTMCFPSANWKREEVPDHKVMLRAQPSSSPKPSLTRPAVAPLNSRHRHSPTAVRLCRHSRVQRYRMWNANEVSRNAYSLVALPMLILPEPGTSGYTSASSSHS